MTPLNLFDAHCYVGRYKTFLPGSFHTVERLLEEMDHYGISEALLTHTTAREHHPTIGNRITSEIAAANPRLHPCWSFIPSASKEIPYPKKFAAEMSAAGVKAVKLFYNFYGVPLSELAVGDYFAAFEWMGVPVFVDPDMELVTWREDAFDWNGIDEICTNHPGLPVILQGARFRSSNRLLYSLMEKHTNLRVELSGYWGYRGIEFICREFGAYRILFGTRLPVRDAGCSVAMVTYAEISDEEKRMIAGDNLRKLLEEVKL